MRKILAVLALGVAVLGPVGAAYADSATGGASHDILVAPALFQVDSNVGVISGPDQAPPGPNYNLRIENHEN
jgi:hypothetical protein